MAFELVYFRITMS